VRSCGARVGEVSLLPPAPPLLRFDTARRVSTVMEERSFRRSRDLDGGQGAGGPVLSVS